MTRTRGRNVQIESRTMHVNEAIKFLTDEAVFQDAINKRSDETIFARQIASEVMREVLPRLSAEWRVTWPVEFLNEVPEAEILREARRLVVLMTKKLAPGYVAKYDAVSNKMVFMRPENAPLMWSGNSRIRTVRRQTSGDREWNLTTTR